MFVERVEQVLPCFAVNDIEEGKKIVNSLLAMIAHKQILKEAISSMMTGMDAVIF